MLLTGRLFTRNTIDQVPVASYRSRSLGYHRCRRLQNDKGGRFDRDLYLARISRLFSFSAAKACRQSAASVLAKGFVIDGIFEPATEIYFSFPPDGRRNDPGEEADLLPEHIQSRG
jgi:hypothetical protein